MSSEESSSKDATVIDDDLVAALGFEPTVRSVDPGDAVLVAADEFDGDDFDTDTDADPELNGVDLLDTPAAGTAVDETAVEDTALDETEFDETAIDEAAFDKAALDDATVEGDTALDDTAVDETALNGDLSDEIVLDEADVDELAVDELAVDEADVDESFTETADDTALDDTALDETAQDHAALDDEEAFDDEAATLVDADLIDLTDSPDEPVLDEPVLGEALLDEAALDETMATDAVDGADLDLDDDRDDDQVISSVFAAPDVIDREDLDDDVDGAEPDLAVFDRDTDDGLVGATATAGASAAAATQLAEEPAKRRRRTAMRARKSRRVLRHVDPWSVLTFSVLFHLCFFAALLLASVLVWRAADAAGTIGNAESFIMELGDYESFEINGDAVFRSALLIAGMLTLASSIMVVLLTVVFNLISDLIGGIRVTVLEEETVRLPAKASKKTR